MVYTWVRQRLLVTLEIPGNSNAAIWIAEYFAARASDMRHTTLLTKFGTPPLFYTISDYGSTVRTAYRGKWIWLSMIDPKPQSASATYLHGHASEKYLHVYTFSQDNAFLHQWLEKEVYPEYKKKTEKFTLVEKFNGEYKRWLTHAYEKSRAWDCVILNQPLQDAILADVRIFEQSRELYRERYIPYRRSYLLHGPPGNGKSSLAMALAGELKVSLSVLSMNNPGLTEEGVMAAFSSNCARTLSEAEVDNAKLNVILVDDFDPTFGEKSKISLPGLLGILDGAMAGSNIIIVFATNHLERIDIHPALIRPGRIDRIFEISAPDSDQICRLFLRFFPKATPKEAIAFARKQHEANPSISMAALQEHFLQNPDLCKTTSLALPPASKAENLPLPHHTAVDATEK